MEGPRGVRTEEFDSLRALTDVVFRPEMPEQYPHLFNEENKENLRVCVDDGKCVSHVGMIVRDASLFGCPTRVCCIGAVSTLPEYRGQGCASACFDDAARKAFEDGVDVMIVSGDRNLYRMRGCMRVGGDTVFSLASDALPDDTGGVTVAPMQGDELPLVTECYRREPVRFLRPLDDYRYAVQSGWVMNRPSDFLVIRSDDGDFRGYVIVQRPGEDRRTRLNEFAGDRHAVLAALPEIVRRYGLADLHWQVQRHDHLFRSLCERAGLTGTKYGAPGTVKLINFPQLMQRVHPRFEELLGSREAADLAFRQDGDAYTFRFGEDALTADRDTATRLLFGTVDGAEEARALEGHGGALAEVLKTILPLPTLWYGINYV